MHCLCPSHWIREFLGVRLGIWHIYHRGKTKNNTCTFTLFFLYIPEPIASSIAGKAAVLRVHAVTYIVIDFCCSVRGYPDSVAIGAFISHDCQATGSWVDRGHPVFKCQAAIRSVDSSHQGRFASCGYEYDYFGTDEQYTS